VKPGKSFPESELPIELVDIPTVDGPLAGAVHLPSLIPASVVVCCHGLLSSKDSDKFITIGKEFSRNGVAVVRFDFSGCGASNALLVSSLIHSRIRDLRAVLDFVSRQPWANGITGLLGSSFGGYLALLAAASEPERLNAVVCWATPFDLEKIKLDPKESENLRNCFPPGFELGSPTSLRGLSPVSRVFVIHGKRDETVSWQDALDIYDCSSDPKRLLIMENVEHRFIDLSSRRLALRLSLEWFISHGFGAESAGWMADRRNEDGSH